MHLGETISYLRKQKGISVNELCSDQISRQAYNKFVSGKSVTSIENFKYFLDVLCVGFDEFFLIHNRFQHEINDEIMIKINYYSNHLELEKLQKINKELESKVNNGDKRLMHLFFISDLFLSKLNQKPFNFNSLKKIKEYLLSVEIWTIYEIVLFSNCIFCFESETINSITKKVIFNFDRLMNDEKYKNESFRMFYNICIHLIKNKEIKNIVTYLNVLKRIELPEEALFEKLSLIFMNDLLSLYHGNHDIKKSIESLLYILEKLNAKKTNKTFTNLYFIVKTQIQIK